MSTMTRGADFATGGAPMALGCCTGFGSWTGAAGSTASKGTASPVSEDSVSGAVTGSGASSSILRIIIRFRAVLDASVATTCAGAGSGTTSCAEAGGSSAGAGCSALGGGGGTVLAGSSPPTAPAPGLRSADAAHSGSGTRCGSVEDLFSTDKGDASVGFSISDAAVTDALTPKLRRRCSQRDWLGFGLGSGGAGSPCTIFCTVMAS
mmetsp:Transcript_37275/g.69392  ORF Transcript_37275/g.69392 Transcript_37275/m.69392 type:complete len:207 (-) Transcript_37275:336-956(-)